MISNQELPTTHALLGKSKPPIPFDSVRHRVGLQNLHRAFNEPQPLVILDGNYPADKQDLISSFLNGLRSDVTVVRIGINCSDTHQGMRDVIRTTGFAPQDMNLIELEIMFVKFLSLQRFHGQRTIFLIEETAENISWVRSKVRDLVELEAAGNFGLMVILSRQSGSHDTAEVPTLDLEMHPAAIDAPKKMRKLFPRAPSTPALNEDEELDLAEWDLTMESDATVPLRKSPKNDAGKLHDLILEQPRLMIGRADDNDLCINAKNVSRHHAILVRHGAAAIIMDLNSTNGTYVNSRRVKDQVIVHHDIIEIGAHRIRFIASTT